VLKSSSDFVPQRLFDASPHSHRHHEHGKASNDGSDGSNCGNVPNEISHGRLLGSLMFSFCSLFVLASIGEQSKNSEKGSMVNLGTTGRRIGLEGSCRRAFPPLTESALGDPGFSVLAGTRRVPRMELVR